MSPFRVGLIGHGFAGSVFHAPLISTTAGLRLSAVVTAQPERQDQVRRDHPGADVVDRVEDLWAQPERLDLVVVATPNRSHVPMATAAVQAGLPVVVDKPLAATAAEGQVLVELAAARGVPLTVFQNRRWDSDFRTAQRLVAEGALGEVLRLESRYERWRPVPDTGWRDARRPGRGRWAALRSRQPPGRPGRFGCSGPRREVYAELDRRRAGARVDDDAFVALHHAGGARSHLWISAVAAESGPRLRLLGSRGAFVIFGMASQEDALLAGRRPDGRDWGREPTERWGRLTVDGRSEPVSSEPGAYPDFYTGVVDMLRHGAPPPVDPADAVTTLTVLEAARRSATERRVVTLGIAR